MTEGGSGAKRSELSATTAATTKQRDLAIKAASKILKKKGKRDEESEIKLKNLVELTCQKLDKKEQPSVSSNQVKRWIKESSKFEISGKKVSLLKKRKKEEESSSSGALGRGKDASSRSLKRPKVTGDQIPDGCGNSGNSDATTAVSKWREDRKIVLVRITVEDSSQTSRDATFFPFRSFDDCRNFIAPTLLQQCTKGNGFTHPSPIQAQAWPILCKGYDVVGIAETGSGKTLGFALPALTRLSSGKMINKSRSISSPRMLVLAPTRELAMQSDEVLQEFGAVVSLKSLVVYGGVPKHQQTSVLKRGQVDCLVATPGRLKDLIQEKSCMLDQVEFLVLDEADRMLDMGFEQDVRFIIAQCPRQDQGRQTCMFSATWPADIQKIAMDFMNPDPIRVYVGFETIRNVDDLVNEDGDATNTTIDDSLSANKRVKQIIHVVDDAQRPGRLRQLLNQVHKTQKERLLLFCLYKKEAEHMEHTLQREGWKCCSIHGNKHQQARTAALQQFKEGSCPLMIATDVAARGLDIPNVQVVINYTFPLTIEDYVHRIGRTGRAGQTGISHTFFQPTADKAHAGSLQHVLRQAEQDIPEELKAFGSTIKKKEHKLYGSFGPKTSQPMKQASKITFESSDEED
ncbi:hypothetical protein ACA910_018123 [Epithemia clementina (nom. ined.)]